VLKWLKKIYWFMTERCLQCGRKKVQLKGPGRTDCPLIKDTLECPTCDTHMADEYFIEGIDIDCKSAFESYEKRKKLLERKP